MLWKIMVFFLLVIIFALLLKIFYMRKAIREIKRGFSEKLYTDTNTPIMLRIDCFYYGKESSIYERKTN